MQLFKKMVPCTKPGSFQLLILLFLYIFTNLKDSVGLDTISPDRPLYRNETLISKGRKFELGFFSPGSSNRSYVGIWYKYISEGTIVWVANKETPIRKFSDHSRLVLAEDGSLILFSDLNEKIWAANDSDVLSSVPNKGVLLDNGNFVLSDGLSTIWQSFDDSTNTWLPGQKVGIVESLTNKGQFLTSWKNPDDPAPGDFSVGMDPTGSPELFMWTNQSQKMWRSGTWNGHNFASFPTPITDFSYNLNGQARYLTYDVFNRTTRFILTDDGRFMQLIWVDRVQAWSVYVTKPAGNCDGFALCGAFSVCDTNLTPVCHCYDGFIPHFPEQWAIADWYSGCIRNKPLDCPRDGFKRMSGISMPANARTLDLGTYDVCQFACLANCSCSAYSYSDDICSIWTNDLLDTRTLVNSQVDLYVRRSDVPRVSKTKKQSYVPVVLSTTIPLLICTSLIYLLWNIRRRKNKKKKDAKETSENLLLLDLEISTKQNTDGNSITADSTLGENKILNLPQFSFSSISAATNNFSPANKLGEGGFGPVYKGNLVGGKSVAVKRLSKRSGQGLEELRNETVLIAKLQHRNLVRLLGCCIEQDEKILIYEYMSNKSLDQFIFDPSKQNLLDWRRRVQIIEGITQGLLYLHQHSRLRIVHRDLKASNVLLDDEMNPKISDFGMARIFLGDELQANTNRIVGTYGYMSPEYAMEGLFSIKSDVFAFGVLLLEILSGKKNTGFRYSDCLNLLGYAWELWKDDRVLELLDSNLDIPFSFVPLRFIHVALLCVQEIPADRPTMSDVLAMFSNEHIQLVSPKRPAFTSGGSLASEIDKPKMFSVNNLTASSMDGR